MAEAMAEAKAAEAKAKAAKASKAKTKAAEVRAAGKAMVTKAAVLVASPMVTTPTTDEKRAEDPSPAQALDDEADRAPPVVDATRHAMAQDSYRSRAQQQQTLQRMKLHELEQQRRQRKARSQHSPTVSPPQWKGPASGKFSTPSDLDSDPLKQVIEASRGGTSNSTESLQTRLAALRGHRGGR